MLKFILFLAAIIIVENLWPGPYRPDLFLLLIITYCVYHSADSAVPFSFAAGFIQDILFSLNFLNTLTKTIVAILISMIKDKLILDFEKLSLILIGVFSPLAIIFTASLRYFIYQQAVAWDLFFVILVCNTILNLLFGFLFLHIIKRFEIYGKQ
ncbi:MAG: rod shape-determining protein MreD [Candidatus Saganbacteria bacterium]|nr:rod shape-determining protein MreD [Candidatus Saganbacteria bacterium]